MNGRTTKAAIITATVAAGAGVLLFATPVLAGGPSAFGSASDATTSVTCPMGGGRWGTDSDDTTDGRNGTGYGTGYGMGSGMGSGMGYGRGNGMMQPGTNLPASGTLTAAQKQTLAAMAEEEKLAHDVYTALASSSGDVRFTMVARSESRHLDAVRVLLDRYGVADPTAGRADGTFATASVQQTYDTLVAKGKASLDAALGVGRQIEKTDVVDLTKAAKGLDAADVTTVYQRLRTASEHHLAMFGG